MHVGIASPRWRGKRSRHSRHMHNPQFYVSGKRPILLKNICPLVTSFYASMTCLTNYGVILTHHWDLLPLSNFTDKWYPILTPNACSHNECDGVMTTGISIICSTVCSGVAQRRHQSSASLAFVRGIHRWPGDSPHKGPVTREMFPFDDEIIQW